jgi:outer membrane lipase/esterase
MLNRVLSHNLIAAIAALATLIPIAGSAEGIDAQSPPPFEQVVVFGDSLSDPGNVFVLTGQYVLRPFEPIPSAPYAIGGFHFTNGETWAESLSRALRSPSGTGPALRVPGFYTNYAFGGARARAGAPGASPNLAAQVGHYLGDAGGSGNGDALYVIWFGANDIRDALQALAVDPSGATSFGMLQAAITAIGQNVLALWSAGARTFLVPNAPNLAVTPALAGQQVQVQAAAAQLSGAYNAALAHPDGPRGNAATTVVRFDGLRCSTARASESVPADE